MTPRLGAGLLVAGIGLVLLARVAVALLPWGLALAAVVGLGGVGVLVVVALGFQSSPDQKDGRYGSTSQRAVTPPPEAKGPPHDFGT